MDELYEGDLSPSLHTAENISPDCVGHKLPNLWIVKVIEVPTTAENSKESWSKYHMAHTWLSSMTFKNCGFSCNKTTFLKPDSIKKYGDLISDDIILDGSNICLLNSSRRICEYLVCWRPIPLFQCHSTPKTSAPVSTNVMQVPWIK